MNKPKTAREWFDMLNEPERSQAIENTVASELDIEARHIHSVADAILMKYDWEYSPQGTTYWQKIHKSINDGTYPFKKEMERESGYYWVKEYADSSPIPLYYSAELEDFHGYENIWLTTKIDDNRRMYASYKFDEDLFWIDKPENRIPEPKEEK